MRGSEKIWSMRLKIQHLLWAGRLHMLTWHIRSITLRQVRQSQVISKCRRIRFTQKSMCPSLLPAAIPYKLRWVQTILPRSRKIETTYAGSFRSLKNHGPRVWQLTLQNRIIDSSGTSKRIDSRGKLMQEMAHPRTIARPSVISQPSEIKTDFSKNINAESAM